GSSLVFDASGSSDQDGSIVTYEWDFDDDGVWDNSVNNATTTHKYTATYTGLVRLRVTDNDGLMSEDTADVVIELPTVAAFSPNAAITLQNPGGGLFTVHDQDMATVDVQAMELQPNFRGTPFGFSTLDAVDLVDLGGCSDPKLIFSVKENRLLGSINNQTIYANKADILSLDLGTGQFELLFDGLSYGVTNVDAVAILDDNSLVFSSEAGFMYEIYWFRDEDLVRFDPVTGDLSLYLKGMEIGVTTLDAVDLLYERVYFSVSEAAYVGHPPFSIYIKPGDIAIYNMITGTIEFFMQGQPYGINRLDAMCLEGLIRKADAVDMQLNSVNPRYGSNPQGPSFGNTVR
ncbi:MAG: PKD domain-containing protein, partial [Planctomycetota bacterium]